MALLEGQLNWSIQTLIQLRTTLAVVYNNPGKAGVKAQEAGLPAGDVPVNSPDMTVMWHEQMVKLAARGALRTLIERARDDLEAAAFQSVFREALDRDDNPIAHAIKDRVFADMAVILLDREPLREKIALLEPDGNTTKVLLVRGNERKSGKTWGQYLFDHVARARGAKSVFMDGITAPTVSEVIDELFSALDASDEKPISNTSAPAYYRAVCRKLKEIAMRRNQPLWIAMDDVGVDENGVPLLDSGEITLFFNQFTAMTRNQDFWPWFRLMLINYPDKAVPREWKKENWVEDRPSRAAVDKDAITAFMKGWLDARGRVMLDTEFDKLVGDVLALGDAAEATAQAAAATADETTAPPPTRLEVIHSALLAKIEPRG